MPVPSNPGSFSGRERGRLAYSLLELLASVVILGVIAALAIGRLSGNSLVARKNACYVNKGAIEMQAQLWYRNKGTWPAANLSDIAVDTSYFAEGLPACPVDATAYTFNSSTGKINGHTH